MLELICLGVSENNMTCYNTLFYVRRTENGSIIVCSQCGAEHEVVVFLQGNTTFR
ncbi:transcription elongation factor Elf1 [Anoxybacillus voinovskiensis]|uniref:Transcription elongation factor Elf1 n=1 Tax=Anoxybacteroides voinovskiense TaxID=230470 RepID=A0A840DR59_9BACL|nr:transcription elongation factor Elf1 [Anoxybacillus voinovskiensis]